MNSEKFTQKALEAIEMSQKLAVQKNHSEISSLHLMFALLTQEAGLVPRIFDKIETILFWLFSILYDISITYHSYKKYKSHTFYEYTPSAKFHASGLCVLTISPLPFFISDAVSLHIHIFST